MYILKENKVSESRLKITEEYFQLYLEREAFELISLKFEYKISRLIGVEEKINLFENLNNMALQQGIEYFPSNEEILLKMLKFYDKEIDAKFKAEIKESTFAH